MTVPGWRALAALSALGAAMLWGTTGTAQALGPESSSPAAVGAARIVVGALVLVLIALRGRGGAGATGPVALTRVPGVALLALGGLAVAAYQVCFFLGVARTGVAVGTVVALGVAPLATGLLGLLLGERPDRRWTLATAGAVAGVVLLVAGSAPSTAAVDGLGVAAALGAGGAYAAFTVTARALILRGASGVRVMAGFFTIGAVLLAPVLALADLRWLLGVPGVVMVLWLGVAATGVSYLLFQRALAGLPAGTVATISLAEPVTATLLGLLVLREALSPLTALGIALVLASLSLMAVRRRG